MPLRSNTQALRLIASIPLIQRRKKCHAREEKAPSRSGFPASMYVVLKTRYVNPISTYVDIRATYVVQTYLPLVYNFYPYAEQQFHIGHRSDLYRFVPPHHRAWMRSLIYQAKLQYDRLTLIIGHHKGSISG